MILSFPDLETVRLALTAGVVPADVALAPAAVSGGPDGRVLVETDLRLPKKVAADLARLSVAGAKRHAAEPEPVSCWPQILPVTRDPAPPALSSQAPVLFDLPAAGLPALVGEMLRLGNDRQTYRMIADADGRERVLLRVVGPPYYTLLRALDADPGRDVRAYTEHAPRVWVELGHSHPLAGQVKPADGQLLLIRPERTWTYLPDAPFRDVYEIVEFLLPHPPAPLEGAAVAEKLTVPLRLAAGNAADAAELWVLRGDAADRLDAFVRDADERVTQRLKFAVATAAGGGRTVVLQTLPSKQPPPVLPLAGAVGFKPYWKIPNLFVPVGTRLHPPLRRDAVRRLLADDPDTLVWLYPGQAGQFTPESVPADSFRPLEDWVEYVIETEREPLAAWIAATRFDFDALVCSDDGRPKPRDPDREPAKGKKSADKPAAPRAKPADSRPSEFAGETSITPVDKPAAAEVKPPSEWRLLRDRLEREFLAADGPLDAAERTRLWPELAAANAALGEAQEAAVCWLNALWSADGPPAEWVAGWLRDESLDDPTPAEVERLLAEPNPTPGGVRAVAAAVLHAATRSPTPAWLPAKLPAIWKYLEAHERQLPVRAVWLVNRRLARLSGADVLGLARVRDRLLQRLLDEGLSAERDLPAFLRLAGVRDADRVRTVRENVRGLYDAVRGWTERSLREKPSSPATQPDNLLTLGYIDFLFAFAFAKLGEPTAAKQLVARAEGVLAHADPTESVAIASAFLARAFADRVGRAAEGKPHAGTLSPDLLAELKRIQTKAQEKPEPDKNQGQNPYTFAYYLVGRMREQSHVLDPQEKLDPYLEWRKESDELKRAIAALPLLPAGPMAARIRELVRDGVKGKTVQEARFLVLAEGLPLAARVGQDFTLELLDLVPGVIQGVTLPTASAANAEPAEEVKQLAKVLERAVFLAAHFDRPELVRRVVAAFTARLNTTPDPQRTQLVNLVAERCIRGLRKLGLRDQIDALLRWMQEAVLGGQTVADLRQRFAARPDQWGRTLQTLLSLAGGWLAFGLTDPAVGILDDARAVLLAPQAGRLPHKDFADLARAYVAAVGHGPADAGVPRLFELFDPAKVPPGRVANSFSSAKAYSRFHLNLAEEVVLALVSDDFALGPAAKRWLDEDEYLVRRRVHADMRGQLDAGGV